MTLRSVAVLGAGTMGAQIAAHFANAGVGVVLLDLTADAARDGLKRARALKPDPFFTADARADHDRRLRHGPRPHCGRRLGSRGHRRAARREARAARTRGRRAARRIDRLVEHVGHPDRRAGRGTERRLPAALARHPFLQSAALSAAARGHPDAGHRSGRRRRVSHFADHRLGKGVVVAKDTPNFIANHLALVGVTRVLQALESGGYTIEEIDAITGPRWAGRRARRSARWTSPVSTSWRTSRTISDFGCRPSSARSSSAVGSARRPGRDSTSARAPRS